MPTPLDHRQLYRLPWNLADNPIAWLEPTQACNLACDGCYRANEKVHKTLAEVGEDLDVFARLRNHDGVSIAGGDPLTHPNLPDIVRMVTARGRKAIINTNGLALTVDLLRELKKAGLVGITFHVDSKQGRPGWRNKTEVQMNELRSKYADMIARVGGISCAFNSTVYEDTLHEVPELVAWAEKNIGLVDTMVFIQYRAAVQGDFDYYAGGEKVDVSNLVYATDQKRRTNITAREVTDVIRTRYPDFAPCAYLNGTSSPDSFKWLVALRVGSKGRTQGWLGPRFMEAVQVGHHLLSGRYLSYAPRWSLGFGRAAMAAALPWDRGARGAALNWAKNLALHPTDSLRRQNIQAIVMIQPIDILQDGRDDMCDGCPDMTVHDGKLMWSCRLEEPRTFGCFLRTTPKKESDGNSKKKPRSLELA
jgi:MoaA/NifB/PqqE/SkfB family radical SAM enzyme